MPRRRIAAVEEEPPHAPLWMVTFADLALLLTTFFLLLVAISSVETGKFREALRHFQGGSGVLPGGDGLTAAEHARRQAALLARLDAAGVGGAVQAEMTARGLRLAVADSVMFQPGEAELVGQAATVLRLVAAAVTPDVTGVVVEGHTDDRPIKTARFPSNWELSAARAATVVRFLLTQPQALDAARYQASGHAEHRPRATNTTAPGRARNRRVEILLTTDPWPSPPSLQSPPPTAP